MANTRKTRRASRKDRKTSRKERKASRKNAVARKERRASRKARRASRKNMMSRRASRKNMMSRRASRKSAVSRKGRRASRKSMTGGRARSPRRGIVSRVYSPVSALGTGAGKTVTTAVSAAANVFGTGVRGIDKTLKTAAGTINSTVSKIFSRRRRADRRH